ncbi:MAG: YpiB family protein [Enterococcus sp.]
MSVSIKEKKAFLNWLLAHASFSRREVSWIVSYLANHEAILKNVHFVERADVAQRGLQIRDLYFGGKALKFKLGENFFYDSDQIFHEMRLNWQEPLYLECLFQNSWENPMYLALLEDNPFLKWSDNISPEIIERIDVFMEQAEQAAKIEQLYLEIDQALEAGDRERFVQLSEQASQLSAQKSHSQKIK